MNWLPFKSVYTHTHIGACMYAYIFKLNTDVCNYIHDMHKYMHTHVYVCNVVYIHGERVLAI